MTDFFIGNVTVSIAPFNILTFTVAEIEFVTVGADSTGIDIKNQITAGVVVNIKSDIIVTDRDLTIVVEFVNIDIANDIKSAATVDNACKLRAFGTAVNAHIPFAGQSNVPIEVAASKNGNGSG